MPDRPDRKGAYAVVLHSGGIDSTLLLHMALEECNKVLALFIKYGQKAYYAEDYAVQRIVGWYQKRERAGTDRLVDMRLDLESVFTGSQSQLNYRNEDLDEWTPEQVATYSGGEVSTSVEFRNGVFIAAATSIALQAGASEVWLGSTGQGASQYADCRQDFLDPLNEAIKAGTDHKVQLFTPLSRLDKSDIIYQVVQLAKRGEYPLALTRTCYDNGTVACGKCLSCVERKEAFDQVGYSDPAAAK